MGKLSQQTVSQEVELLKKLSKKYCGSIPELDVEYRLPPEEMIDEVQQELNILLDPIEDKIKFEFPDSKYYVTVYFEAIWNLCEEEFEIDCYKLTSNIPAIFKNMLKEFLEQDRIPYPIVVKIRQLPVLKKREVQIRKLMQKMKKLEDKYPAFSAYDWFDVVIHPS